MNILLVVDCYHPSPKSVAQLAGDLALEFARQKHGITVLTPSDELTSACEVRDEDGVRVIRVRSPRLKGARLARRALNELLLSPRLWLGGNKILKGLSIDLVVYYSPSIFLAPLVWFLKRRYRCRSYLILRDLFPQWALDAGIIKNGVVLRYFRVFERINYWVADTIGIQSPSNRLYFEERFPGFVRRLKVLFNWTKTWGDSASSEVRIRLGLSPENILFVFGGTIGQAQGLEQLIELAQELSDSPAAHLLFLGDGSEVPKLKRMATEHNLSNVSFISSVGQDEYLKLLSGADVGLISLKRELSTHNIPGKLLGYANCRLPVLAAIGENSDLEAVLSQHNSGLVCPADDIPALVANARRLISDKELRTQMGERNRLLLESLFSVKSAATQILESARSSS